MLCKLTKCCCCLPLRPGLLVFGYIMLISSYISLVQMLCRMNDIFQGTTNTTPMDYIILSLAFGVTAVQFTFNVIFLAALHKNSSELLEAYYECNMCMLATQITVAAFYIPLQVYRWRNVETNVWWLGIAMVLIAAVSISVQYYIVSLVRSQLRVIKQNEDIENAVPPISASDVGGPSDDRRINK